MRYNGVLCRASADTFLEATLNYGEKSAIEVCFIKVLSNSMRPLDGVVMENVLSL